MKTINWTCPHCLVSNEDVYGETSFPMCESCGGHVDWYQIFSKDYSHIIYVTEHPLYNKWDIQIDPLIKSSLYLYQFDISENSIDKIVYQATCLEERVKSLCHVQYTYVLEK